MTNRKRILAISGSTRENSSNLQILQNIKKITSEMYEIFIFDGLDKLPHFNPDLDNENQLPPIITDFRNQISNSDGVIICTPEYVFSIPGSLKNALEWCVSTTIFTDKPTGIITASASGEKGHQQLQMILQTLGCKFNNDTAILIKGIKGKFNEQGDITDVETLDKIKNFLKCLNEQL